MKILFFLLFPVLVSAKSFLPNSFSAQYENSWKSATGSVRLEKGRIDYKFPSNFKLDVQGEVPTTYVTNGKQTWIFQPAFNKEEKDQVTISRAAGHPVIKLLNSLRNTDEKSPYYEAKENGKDLVLTFNAVGQKEFSLKEVVVRGTKPFKDVASLNDVKAIEMTDTNKLPKRLKFVELKEGVSFPPNYFNFQVPAGAKQIRN